MRSLLARFGRLVGGMFVVGGLLAMAGASRAAEYDIGPGQALTRIGQVALHDLQAGDVVRIHWRPEPYREKFRVSGEGTVLQPIRIVGVAGPNGERPVINGENATTHPGDIWPHFTVGGIDQSLEDLGVIMVFRGPGRPYSYKPKHIRIEGLEVTRGRKLYTFTDATGATRRFGGSGIYILGAEDVVIENCRIHDCGDGLFAKSNGDEPTATRRLRVRRCHIENNSEVPPPPPAFAFASHNIYTECFDIVFEENYLGPTRPGSDGGNLKDRSSGTVIRYNWIEGGLRLIDLVEAQDSWPMAREDPTYHVAHVYGNYLVAGPGAAGTAVHYGGDSGTADTYRKGTLHFHHNTVVFRRDQSEAYRVRIFELTSNDETVLAWNNLFYREAFTPGATPTLLYLGLNAGHHVLGPTWASAGWEPWDNGIPGIGTMTGLTNVTSVGTDGPGFVNRASADYRLGAYATARDLGAPLPAGAPPVASQYIAHRQIQNRPPAGAPDLGAHEFVPPPGPVAPEAHGQNLDAVQNTPLAIRLTGYDGNGDPLSFAVVSGPEHGRLVGTPPSLVYHPPTNYLGADVFAFAASDGALTSPPAEIRLRIDRPRHRLQVQNGSGSGDYVSGTIVRLVAAEPPSGRGFASWAGATVADPSAAETTLVMPDSDVTVAALFRPVPPPGGPFVHEVGPGKTHASLSSVPWKRLYPGDEVRVHWRPEPYAEKVLIPARGTASAPVRLIGIPGPAGQRPVISGANAVLGTNAAFASWDIAPYLGLVTVARAEGESPYDKPGHVEIRGLELRDITGTPEGVSPVIWYEGAAAIRLDAAEHVRIVDCMIQDVPSGIVARRNGGEFGLSRDLTIERCHVRRTGTPGRYGTANLDVEVAGLTVRGCRFDAPVPGAFGDNVLDRSAGTVFEANRVEGAARMLEFGAPVGPDGDVIRNDPRFSRTRVAGNLILVTHRDAGAPVYCGADPQQPDRPRTGMLEFVHNTMIVSNGAYQVNVPVVAPGLAVDFRHNIVRRLGAEILQLLGGSGRLVAGVNWLSPGWQPSPTATIEGATSILTQPDNDPGLDVSGALRPGSPCRDAAPALLTDRQYLDPAQGIWRGTVGASADLGAFEADLGAPTQVPTLSGGWIGGTTFRVTLVGSPHAAHRILRSGDLRTWEPLGPPVVLDAQGTGSVVDAASGSDAWRFYRGD